MKLLKFERSVSSRGETTRILVLLNRMSIEDQVDPRWLVVELQLWQFRRDGSANIDRRLTSPSFGQYIFRRQVVPMCWAGRAVATPIGGMTCFRLA